MAQSVFNADTVAKSYGLDLAPTLGVMSAFQERQDQQARLAAAAKRQAKVDQAAALDTIDATINPLEKGTGYSPYDDLNTHLLGQVKDKAISMAMNKVDPGTIRLYLNQATNGIKSRQLDATKGVTATDLYAKAAVTKDPKLDYDQMRQQYQDNIFTTIDGKGKKVFNPNFDPSQDFYTNVTPVYDPMKTAQLADAAIPKLFAERPSAVVRGKDGIDYSGKLPPNQKPNAETGLSEYDYTPIPIKMNDGTVAPTNVFKDNIIAQAYADPDIKVHLGFLEKQVKKMLPDNVSEDDLRRITATHYLEQRGPQPGIGLAADDSYLRAAEAAAQSDRQFNLSERRMQQSDDHFNKTYGRLVAGMNSNNGTLIDPLTVASNYLSGVPPKTEAEKNIRNSSTKYRYFHDNPEMGKAAVPVIDLQLAAQKDYLHDPYTGQPVKVSAFNDGEPGLAVEYYEGAGQKITKATDKKTAILKGSELDSYMQGIAPQMQLASKNKKLNYAASGTK